MVPTHQQYEPHDLSTPEYFASKLPNPANATIDARLTTIQETVDDRPQRPRYHENLEIRTEWRQFAINEAAPPVFPAHPSGIRRLPRGSHQVRRMKPKPTLPAPTMHYPIHGHELSRPPPIDPWHLPAVSPPQNPRGIHLPRSVAVAATESSATCLHVWHCGGTQLRHPGPIDGDQPAGPLAPHRSNRKLTVSPRVRRSTFSNLEPLTSHPSPPPSHWNGHHQVRQSYSSYGTFNHSCNSQLGNPTVPPPQCLTPVCVDGIARSVRTVLVLDTTHSTLLSMPRCLSAHRVSHHSFTAISSRCCWISVFVPVSTPALPWPHVAGEHPGQLSAAVTTASRICPSCQTETNDARRVFCRRCGNRLAPLAHSQRSVSMLSPFLTSSGIHQPWSGPPEDQAIETKENPGRLCQVTGRPSQTSCTLLSNPWLVTVGRL